MAEIVLKHLSKQLADGTVLLRDIDLQIRDGEFFILVGPSGCGKSTLLNLIAGLDELSDGEIQLDGRRINDLDARERDMAMVFQSYALYPHMTVRENLAFPLKLAKLPREKIAERVSEVAASLGVSEVLDRKPAKLSGGQRQRVAMGRAIVRRPTVFLLDEPLSNLDARLRVQMRAEIAALQDRLATTTIYVTHDQTEAMTLGDRVAVMRKGCIQQVDTPQRLYEQPRNVFVAGFIGSPRMNFLPAQWDGTALDLGLARIRLPAGRELSSGLGRQTLIAGFRPEHLRLIARDERHSEEEYTFDVSVTHVEWLGAEQHVHFRAPIVNEAPLRLLRNELESEVDARAGLSLTARVVADRELRVGATQRLALDIRRLHLFRADNGERYAAESRKD